MSDNSEYTMLLDSASREYCRMRGWEPDGEYIGNTTYLQQGKEAVSEMVDHTIKGIALHRATKEVFGDD